MDELKKETTAPLSSPLEANIEIPAPKKSSAGSVIGIIIILIILVLGGLYFWGAKLNQGNYDDQLPFIPSDDNRMMQNNTSSNSDAVVDITADVQGSSAELDAMDAEIEQALKQMDTELSAQSQ